MNELIVSYQRRERARARASRRWHSVSRCAWSTPFTIGPSEDLALVAERCAHRMPRILRHVMDGLGTPDAQSADLMSYLLFDGSYTRTLIDIGYRDASARDRRARALPPHRSRDRRGLTITGSSPDQYRCDLPSAFVRFFLYGRTHQCYCRLSAVHPSADDGDPRRLTVLRRMPCVPPSS